MKGLGVSTVSSQIRNSLDGGQVGEPGSLQKMQSTTGLRAGGCTGCHLPPVNDADPTKRALLTLSWISRHAMIS